MKIDTSKWGEFKVEDLFDILKVTNKLKNSDLVDNGSVLVYSSTTENNGIFGKTNKPAEFTISNQIPFYLIFGDHTRSMSIVKNDFSVMDNVKILKPHIFNEYIIQFIITIWKKSIPNLGYARHWTVAKNIQILLPITSDGELDYKYMEEYIKKIENTVSSSLTKIQSAQNKKKEKIDVSCWKEFKVGEFFDAERGKVKGLQQKEIGTIPVIAAARQNQGIAGFYNVEALFENKITISCNGVGCGSAFYHPYKFNINGDAIVLTEKIEMSDSIKQFITCILDATFIRKYSYEEKCSVDKAKNEIIKLPIDSDGSPNWNYMEECMKKIEKNIKNKLNSLYNK